MNQFLEIEKERPLTWLKLNRPDVLNSLNVKLLQELCEACAMLEEDNDTRVIAIIGAGPKVFSAGADLTERKGMSEGQVIDYLQLIQKTFSCLESLSKPVIAAINGSAFGGGTELALACDLRVMAEEASLRLTEVTLGIIPGAGGTQRLPRLIGKSKAKECILTAKPLTAEEGYRLGLIHRVIPKATFGEGYYHEKLMDDVRAWASEIARYAPLALAQAKLAIDHGFDRDLEAGLAIETKAYLKLVNTEDRREGLKAFAEKRQPAYVGK
jgi:enoyl-CoA hydratase/carnithine racemase